MVEPGINQLRQPRLGYAKAGSDEICIKAGLTSTGDQFFEIGACCRLASGQMQMENAKPTCFLKHSDPFACGKLRLRRNQLQRIGAIHAVQRATMRDFGDQRQWVWNHQ